MRKKWLCSLLTAALLLSLFPTAALADEDGPDASAEGVVETVAEEQAVVDPELLEMLPSNDELFSAYVDLAFAGEDADVPSIFGVGHPAGEDLKEANATIYDYLKTEIQIVAKAGGSTVFELPSDSFASLKTTWTASELEGTSIEEAYKEELNKIDISAINTALLMDCPYELYWYNKSVDNAIFIGFSVSIVTSGDGTKTVTYSGTASFKVVPEYQGTDGDTSVKTDVSKVQKAVDTANEIVNKEYTSDYARLRGYMEAICNLVSYNDAASKDDWTEGYGNPWQLIWVFDGDENTNVVCEGYAKAFQYLCDLTQSQKKFTDNTIESYIVTGTMAGGTGEGPHMWNIVSIGGKSYLVDVTNCDTGSIGTPDKLFLVGNATAGFNPSNGTIAIDGVPNLTYQYDSDMVSTWGSEILTLADKAYRPYTPVATTVKILKGNKEITEDTLAIGSTATYTAKVLDQNDVEMTGEGVTWKSSDESIIKVTDTNNPCTVKVSSTASAEDVATLTATFSGNISEDNEVSLASVDIKISEKLKHEISVSPEKVELMAGEKKQLVPNSSTGGTEFTYESAAQNIATVDSNGVITAVGIGTTHITVTVAETTQYAANSIQVPVIVTAKTLTAAMVTLEGTSFTYTGKAIEPKVSITGLTQDTDFTVAYNKNVDAGTATVTVSGMGSYSGTVTKEFTIEKAELVLSKGESFDMWANSDDNANEASLLSIVKTNNPSQAVSGQTVELEWVRTSPAYNRKGATYTFTGTGKLTAEQAKNYVCSNTATVTVEVKPVTVKSVTVTATTTTVKANAIDDYELPTAGTVEYNEIEGDSINIGWPANAKDTLKAAADKMGDASNTTVTLTAESVDFPDWATVPASFAMPTLTVTITNKEQAAVTFDNGTSLGGIYGDTFAEPEVTVNIGTATPDEEGVKFSYTGTTLNGASYSSAEMPKDAGNYTVTATYEDSTYFGSASVNFFIDAKSIDLDWNGLGTEESPLTYSGAPMNITASIPADSLVNGDTCTVTVTGGDKIDAGAYTAKATLSNKNYKATNAEVDYTIQKGDRNVYISDDKTDITGKTLNLYPATGLSKEILVSYSNVDDVDPKYQLTGNASAVKLTTRGNQATVTAVGNGSATLTVSFDETDNYKGVSVSCTIEAVAKPISQISIGSKDETVDLTAKLDGSTIKVVGLGDPDKVCVKLVPAEDVRITLEQSPDSETIVANGDKITLKDDSNLIAEYTVDLSGVTKVPENTTVKEKPGTATAPENASEDLKNAATNLTPTSEGLVSAAKDLILEAAELAKNEGADSVTIEASLKVEVKSLDTTSTNKTFRLDVTPVYTITTTTNGVSSEKVEKPIANEQLNNDVTITVSVKLPINFPTSDVFARHYKNGAVAEILRVVVADGIASWQQSSFSEIELFSETRHGSIAFVMDDGSQESLNIDAASLGMALPTRAKDGYTFKGWKIGGKVYTTVTDELLTALGNGNALTAEAQFEKNSDPVTPPVAPEKPSTPSTSGGSGGGGSSGTTNRKISFNSSSNGSVTYTPSNPSKGTKVTLTAKPKSGYVLDTLRVLDAKGNELELTKTSDGKYTFIMPDGKVTVDAKFAEEGSQTQTKDFPFTDAEDSWARDAIAWAYENGYVNGTSATTFNPNGSITRQQMWMILARLSGASPANMTEAREWAMSSGVTDGTNGGNAMTRQQMVTFLYRYAQNRGYTTGGGTSLDSFPDNATVSAYAREPLAWAVGNGIVAGTSDGNLNPGGGATRAQFAMILQRFYNNTVES